MASVLNQGRLKTWKDDRGFGFIKPDDGGKDVFLHISALKGAGRRPKVGDKILYQLVVQPNGKVSAAQASIQGVKPRLFSTKGKRKKQGLFKTVLRFGFLIAFAIALGPSVFLSITRSIEKSEVRSIEKPEVRSIEKPEVRSIEKPEVRSTAKPEVRSIEKPEVRSIEKPEVRSILKPECNIKGNISYNTGNKIYHLPGMEDYQSTKINPTKGERWFCSESEAIANGWRKAPR